MRYRTQDATYPGIYSPCGKHRREAYVSYRSAYHIDNKAAACTERHAKRFAPQNKAERSCGKTGKTDTGASVALLDPKACLDAPAPAQPSRTVMSHATSEDEFSRLQADKNDMAVLALEDAAREAANTIFSLRRHRIELITGEAGENVFGEGLKAALAEIERLEQSYLELFLGKRVVTTETRRYVVYPQSDKKQYIVCRFSAAAGLLPESDLSGDMVLLQIEPSGNTATAVEASAKESNTVTCRVADPSVCTVIAGGREYARAVLPLFEFGRTINVALPRRK